jgi:hypothetical protein
MQAVNYAAMVSRLTPRDVAEMYAETRTQSGTPLDADSALALLETERLLTAESIRRPRIVLIASQFPPSVTAAVVWLNEQGVEISLVRFRPYAVDDGRVVVSFSRFFPVPDVEEFTIGRRVAVEEDGPDELGPPWDYPSLARLAESGNQATLTMLDLCAVEDAGAVTVRDIAEHAALKDGQIRGQLAGLTMRLRNQKHGFAQKRWPVTVKYLPGGVASYTMGPELAKSWRTIRQLNPSS